MNDLPRYAPDGIHRRMERIDHLLQTLAGLTPRQATVFLLHFDGCFSWIVGREATATERMVAIAALRRLVREHG